MTTDRDFRRIAAVSVLEVLMPEAMA